MKHLITGGCGFLGMIIAEKLIARGDEVISLDIWETPDQLPEVQFVSGSVLDRELVRRLMQGVDVVHHTAALVPLTKENDKFQEVNVMGSRVVAEEAARAGVKYFVHTSSSAIFGKPKCPAGNSSPLRPVERYGASKLEGERAVEEVARQNNMPLIVVRPRTLIGTGRLGIFQILFEWIKEGRNVYVIGDGKNKIQFLHADDLIDCYMFLCEQEKPGFYNVGTDRFGTLEETLNALIAHAGTATRVKHLPKQLAVETLSALDKLGMSPLAPWHYLTYGEDFYFDLTPLEELGWKPKYSNVEMLCDGYDQFISNYAASRTKQGGSPHRKRVKEKLLWVLKQLS